MQEVHFVLILICRSIEYRGDIAYTSISYRGELVSGLTVPLSVEMNLKLRDELTIKKCQPI